MNSISRKLEQSLARGPVPRNDLLEKETINKQLVLVDLLATEHARFAQEIQGMETSLAEERQARLQAEQRAGEATAVGPTTPSNVGAVNLRNRRKRNRI